MTPLVPGEVPPHPRIRDAAKKTLVNTTVRFTTAYPPSSHG